MRGLAADGPEVRREAADKLGSSGPQARAAVPAQIARLTDEAPDVADMAADYALDEIGIGHDVSRSEFLHLLRRPNPSSAHGLRSIVRIEAEMIAAIGPVAGPPADPEAPVGDAAFRLLQPPIGVPLQDSGSAPGANRTATSGHTGPRDLHAVRLLTQDLDHPESAPAFAALRDDLDVLTRRAVPAALAWAGRAGVEGLAACLRSDDPTTGRLAAIALSRPEVVAGGHLAAVLADSTAPARREAARSLGTLKDEAADFGGRRGPLRHDGDGQLRFWAARAVARLRFGDEAVAGSLRRAVAGDPSLTSNGWRPNRSRPARTQSFTSGKPSGSCSTAPGVMPTRTSGANPPSRFPS